jgi:hypothetical protein
MPEPIEPVTVEERLAALEREVAKLSIKLEQLVNPKGNWIERMITRKPNDNPAFEEAMRLGAEIRRADRPPDEP